MVGLVVQAAATAPSGPLGPDRTWLVLLLVATFVGGVANLVAIVGYVVTATSGLPDHEQGLATGLVTLSQQVGITMGIPLMSAVVARVSRDDDVLHGITTAIGVNAVLCVAASLVVLVALRPARQ